MNKAQLIDRLSGQLGSKKAANDAVEAVLDTITRAVASGEKVAITGFGVFEKVARPARTGRNPRTGETVKIKKTSVPKFKPGQGFKDVVSGAKKLPKVAATAARSAAGTASRATGATSRSTSTAAKKSAPARKAAAKKSTTARGTATKSSAGRTLAAKKSAAPAKKSAAKKLATKSTTKKATARKR